MKIKEMSKEDLEMISFDDLAYMILVESKKKLKINDLFKKVCDLKGLSDAVFENKIADFFEVLTTDQRFYMLDNGLWDLKERHTNKIKINTSELEEDEEDDELLEDEEEVEMEEEEEDIFYEHDETDDEAEDDLKDLVIIDENEEETDNL
ncbi:MAG: DNA-directed RNA polymerase subunit delta [Bacilli bacterium]|nr:DNA-directed RNA polymerase subunit delta [Bacilli bacterium]